MGILCAFLLMIVAKLLNDYGPRLRRRKMSPASKPATTRPLQSESPATKIIWDPIQKMGQCERCGMLLSVKDPECFRCGASNADHVPAPDTTVALYREIGEKAAQAYARATGCPRCGAGGRRTLTLVDRVSTGAGYIGTVGKQYICGHCNHMW